jgi:uncharacterized protein (TIGR00369 family)
MDAPVNGGFQWHVPFNAHLGLVRERAEDGEAVVSVVLSPELLNHHGGAHGGVVMTLLDSAMASAAVSRVGFERHVLTVDMHVSFMRLGEGRLVATAKATGGGRSLCFCEASVQDAHGHLVARAMGTFRYRDPR